MSDLTYKVRAPLKLTLETGKSVAIENWSLSGITYPEPADILPKVALLSIPFQGVEVQFDVRFANSPNKGELLFEGLSGRQRETLAVFYRSILSGKMASTEEVITSLDTPVDLVPMGETEEERSVGSANTSNRLLRILWNAFFYLGLAFLIFGVIGTQIFNRLSQVSLEHARISAPLVEHRATEDAFIDAILVEQGQHVSRGDTLIRLNLPNQESALEDIREDIERAERDVAAALSNLMNHQTIRQQQRQLLADAYQRAVSAHPNTRFGSSTNIRRIFYTRWQFDRFDQETQLAQGTYFDTERDLRRQYEATDTRLSRLKRDLGNTKDIIDAINIVAQVDGIVQSVEVFKDQYVSRGDEVLTIEEDAPRVVRAWLNEARSEAIFVGMQTNIRFNDGSGTRSVDGQITDITAGIDLQATDEYGLIVTVAIDDLPPEDLRGQFRPDAPVSLSAIKDWGWLENWDRK